MKIVGKRSLTASWLIGLMLMGAHATIELGMDRDDVGRICPLASSVLVMTEPANLAEGYSVVIDGHQFVLAFGDDGKLAKILTASRDFRLKDGIGVGSTFADVKRVFTGVEISAVQYMGRTASLEDGGVTVAFPLREDGRAEVDDNERVSGIMFRRLQVGLCKAAERPE